MAKETLQTLILYGGGVIITYYVLKSWGIISEPCDPSICTSQCPRGPKYSRGLFGDCKPNYVACDWDTNCCCLSAASLDTWNPLTKEEMNNLTIK